MEPGTSRKAKSCEDLSAIKHLTLEEKREMLVKLNKGHHTFHDDTAPSLALHQKQLAMKKTIQENIVCIPIEFEFLNETEELENFNQFLRNHYCEEFTEFIHAFRISCATSDVTLKLHCYQSMFLYFLSNFDNKSDPFRKQLFCNCEDPHTIYVECPENIKESLRKLFDTLKERSTRMNAFVLMTTLSKIEKYFNRVIGIVSVEYEKQRDVYQKKRSKRGKTMPKCCYCCMSELPSRPSNLIAEEISFGWKFFNLMQFMTSKEMQEKYKPPYKLDQIYLNFNLDLLLSYSRFPNLVFDFVHFSVQCKIEYFQEVNKEKKIIYYQVQILYFLLDQLINFFKKT